MIFKKLLLVTFLAAAVSACGGESGGTDGNSSVIFSVLLSANCAGALTSADVIFDNRFIATLTPGGTTNIRTTIGEHTLEAIGNTGATIGPLQLVIEFDGQQRTLTCNNI